MSVTAPLFALPLVGREAEMAALHAVLDDIDAGRGGRTVIVRGEAGVGKTRLMHGAADSARRRGWTVAVGHAYPVETGVPYAPVADALLPTLRQLDATTLTTLTRGGSAELAYLFPALSTAGDRVGVASRDDPAEFKSRLLWNFAQFLSRLAAKRPLLVVLENLQWADASSLELLHFTARQLSGDRIALLCTYNEAARDSNAMLRATEQSLVAQGATVMRLEPLARGAVDDLLAKLFDCEPPVTRDFAALLYEWTRGNAFFIEETLKSLIASGRLYLRDGRWFGWEVADLGLPRTIRDAVLERVGRLSAGARAVAELIAVIGTRVRFDALQTLHDAPLPELLCSLDELRHQHVVAESAEGDAVVYDFSHPILRETLYGECGLARAKMLHAVVAAGLERFYGAAAPEHADELAYHFARAESRGVAAKALEYLTAAGRRALARHANREAANYLGAALELRDRAEGGSPPGDATLVEDLAQACQRLGEYDTALTHWERARREAERARDDARVAEIERRMGLACYWAGRYQEALSHYDAGLAAAERAGAEATSAKLLLARATCLQGLGDPAAAARELARALEIAERIGDKTLLARVRRGLLLLHLWTGEPERARLEGARVIALAEETGQAALAWSAHWALAIVDGLTANVAQTAEHIAASERLADELRSPVLRLWTAEIAIEYASAVGEWGNALALAERTIALARSLNQRALLPRLLIWTALLYFGRGDVERGKAYVDEAAAMNKARSGTRATSQVDVHSAVLLHTGLAYYHMTQGELEEAIRVGEEGLAIADRSGYVVWAVYRLLPVVAESWLRMGDLRQLEQHVDRAERLVRRLRRESERLGHKLGLAWADAGEALLPRVRGDDERAVDLLRRAVAGLEAVPFVFDSARLRRELAISLTHLGDKVGALRELRQAHDVFARLGAERELERIRDEIRALGGRPPARTPGEGVGALTGREAEIVRLVALRKSNKEIARALGISPRTVSTHLSNIFEKVGVGSRGELADFARRAELAGP